MADFNGLPIPKRYITGHNAEGRAIFLKQLDHDLPLETLAQLPLEGTSVPAKVGLVYATNEFPPKLNNERDLKTYQGFLQSSPGISIKHGSVVRILDFPPGSRAPMHKTQSLDYGVVLEGSTVAGLDSGETQTLQRGDIVVQRATSHNWANASDTEWARMLFVLLDADDK